MPELKIGALFAGMGGLEMGVQAVLGGDVAWHSEIDPGACKILAHRYPTVPNLGDITSVDWSAVEPVDVLTGGFPCTDVSCAGLRLGLTPDTRSGLWSQMVRAIVALRPSLVVIENVRGLLSAHADHPAHSDLEPCPWELGDGSGPTLRALGAVLGDLADAGFDAEWVGLRAADVGAPHGRFRVFVVAWPANPDSEPRPRDWDAFVGDSAGAVRPGEALPRRRCGAAAHPACHGRSEGWPESARLVRGSDASVGGGAAPANSDGNGLVGQPGSPTGRNAVQLDERDDAYGRGDDVDADPTRYPRRLGDRDGVPAVEWGPYAEAVRRWERVLGRSAPSPTELGAKGNARLSPRFVEFLMGLPAGWVTDVPGLSRNEQLKALGNGVVPAQAAQALRMLLPDVARAAA